MLFEAKYASPERVRVGGVWVAGDVLFFAGKFHNYIGSRDLSKQEGLIHRHLLRMVLLLDEFHAADPARSRPRRMAQRAADNLRRIDRSVSPGGPGDDRPGIGSGGGDGRRETGVVAKGTRRFRMRWRRNWWTTSVRECWGTSRSGCGRWKRLVHRMLGFARKDNPAEAFGGIASNRLNRAGTSYVPSLASRAARGRSTVSTQFKSPPMVQRRGEVFRMVEFAGPTILMCAPDFYGIEYEINPWMSKEKGADVARAQAQWRDLRDILVRLGVDIRYQPPVQGLPDLVFTANAGLICRDLAIAATFRHGPRQGKPRMTRRSSSRAGSGRFSLPRRWTSRGRGTRCFAAIRCSAVPHPQRCPGVAMGRPAVWLPGDPAAVGQHHYYHLDTCFCPLSPREALYFPGAFDKYGLQAFGTPFPN